MTTFVLNQVVELRIVNPEDEKRTYGVRVRIRGVSETPYDWRTYNVAFTLKPSSDLAVPCEFGIDNVPGSMLHAL